MKMTACNEAEELQKVVVHLQDEIESKKRTVILLRGALGAGKTTLVKKYVELLGYDPSLVDSPTFSLVNTYNLGTHTIHHFDLYRLDRAEEIEEIGFFEYIDSGDVCFIEWPDKIADFLPGDKRIELDITVSSSTCRDYSFLY